MNVLTVRVLVHQISYQFSLDGSIVPYINIFPTLTLPNGRIIQRIPFPTGASVGQSDTDIAAKDKLLISIPEREDLPLLFKIDEKSSEPRHALTTQRCPVCDSPLFASTIGIGRCINRTCMGQISHTIILFAAALGLLFQHPVRRIFEALLARGALNSPTSLFMLQDVDLMFPGIMPLEAHTFLRYVHSVRGNITVDQLLNSLRIPDFPDQSISYVRQLFEKNKWTLPYLLNFFDPEELKKHKQIDWDPWITFISLEQNRKLIAELCQILYI